MDKSIDFNRDAEPGELTRHCVFAAGGGWVQVVVWSDESVSVGVCEGGTQKPQTWVTLPRDLAYLLLPMVRAAVE